MDFHNFFHNFANPKKIKKNHCSENAALYKPVMQFHVKILYLHVTEYPVFFTVILILNSVLYTNYLTIRYISVISF